MVTPGVAQARIASIRPPTPVSYNVGIELAMAMLAIFLSAASLVSGLFYVEGVDTPARGAGLTRQADVSDVASANAIPT